MRFLSWEVKERRIEDSLMDPQLEFLPETLSYWKINIG